MGEQIKDSSQAQATVSDLLQETRTFPPSEEFKKRSEVKDDALYKLAAQDRLKFWEQNAKRIDWFKPWDKTLEWNLPFAKWFVGAELNASYNCLDRHIKTGLGNKIAIYWEGEPGDSRALTFKDVFTAVNKFANCLKSLGIKKGDRVAIYMPMIPEVAFAMLACSRIGAIHTVVFGGFSVDSLRDRINDAQAKLLITADGGYRRGKIIPLKETSDAAVKDCPSIEHTIVVERTKNHVEMKAGRDFWYHDLMSKAADFCEPESMDSEDILFILYTSGTTGKPKGIVHTT